MDNNSLMSNVGSEASPLLVPPGRYALFTVVFATVTTQNARIWFDVWINGQTSLNNPNQNLAPVDEAIGQNGTEALRSGFALTEFPAPTPFWMQLKVAKGGGNGSVTFKQASFLMLKIG